MSDASLSNFDDRDPHDGETVDDARPLIALQPISEGITEPRDSAPRDSAPLDIDPAGEFAERRVDELGGESSSPDSSLRTLSFRPADEAPKKRGFLRKPAQVSDQPNPSRSLSKKTAISPAELLGTDESARTGDEADRPRRTISLTKEEAKLRLAPAAKAVQKAFTDVGGGDQNALRPDERVEAECLTLVGPELHRMLMVTFPLAAITVGALWSHAGAGRLLLWLGLTIASMAILMFVAGFEPHFDLPEAVVHRRREIQIACGAVGCSWGAGVLFIYPSVDGAQYRLVLAAAAVGAFASMGLGTLLMRSATYAFGLPIATAVVGRFGLGSSSSERFAAITMAVIALGFFLHSSAANRTSVLLVRNRIENDLLTRKLKRAQEVRVVMELELQRVSSGPSRDPDVDPVTGLKNRKAFLDAVGDLWQHADSGFDPFSIAMIEIDRFDDIREAHGIEVANELLRSVTAMIDLGLRTDDTLARVGAGQFSVVLANALTDGAVICLERIRRKIAATPIDAGEPLMVTISTGIVTWEKGMGIRQLMSRADMSLQRALKNGNTVWGWGDALRSIPGVTTRRPEAS